MQQLPNVKFLSSLVCAQLAKCKVPEITAGKLAGSEFMRKLCRAVLIPSHKPS